MKLNNNIQKLRKENHMSQEQLAEKLNVSRQAVSKWESGSAYPEMDKIIAMTKLFNCSIDSLMNEEVTRGNQTKKINKIFVYKDEIFKFIKKSVNLFSNMKLFDLIKCFLVLSFIIGILFLFKIPINYVTGRGLEVFYIFPDVISNIFISCCRVIIDLVYFVIATIIFIYIFKIKYLDNEMTNVTNFYHDEEPSTKKESEKVIIKKEEEHSIFDFMASVILYFIKFMAILVIIPLSILLLILAVCFAISIALIFNKVFYLGIPIAILGMLSINIVFIEILFSFIFGIMQKVKKNFITFIISVLLVGVGFGITTLDVAKSSYKNTAPSDFSLATKTFNIKMQGDLLINYHYLIKDINYVVDNSLKEEVKIDLNHYKEFTEYNLENNNNIINICEYNYDINFNLLYQTIIKDLQNKKFHNYNLLSLATMTITSSEENLNKIKANYYENEGIEEYQNKIAN